MADGLRTLVQGSSGEGKTVLLCELAKQHPWLIVHDVDGDLAVKLKGFKVFYHMDDLLKYCQEHHEDKTLKVIFSYDQNAIAKPNFEKDLENLCHIAWSLSRGFMEGDHNREYGILADEVGDSYPLHPKECDTYREAVIRKGRKHGIHFLAGTQAPQNANMQIRRNLSLSISFYLTNENARKSVQAQMGGLAGVENKLLELQKFHYLVWNAADPRTVTIKKPVPI